jgi:hypothetical protein
MSYIFNEKGTKFISNSTMSVTRYILNVIGILALSLGEYYFIKQSITKGIGGDSLYVIFCPFILWGLFKYVITDCNNKLELTKDKLIIYKAKRIYDSSVEPLLIPYKSISKIRFTNDECLAINNIENDADDSLDLSYFDNIDIQLMINHLCKNVVVEIESGIAEEKGLKLPDYAISKDSGSISRRRNVISDKTKEKVVKEDKKTTKNRVVTNNRRLELSEESQSKIKSDNKRRLEL